MRIVAKTVAMVLAVLLGAAPALAAIPCTAGAGAIKNHACCAGRIAESSAASQSASGSLLAITPLATPSCCKGQPYESSMQPIAREARPPVSDSVLIAEASPVVLAIPASPSREVRLLPDRPIGSHVHSILCTFRI